MLDLLGTYNDLVNRIAVEVKEILNESFVHSSENKVTKINVFEGFMPARNSRNKQDEKQDYPAVIVRFKKARNSIDKTEKLASVRFVIATYNDSDDGWRENLNIAQRLENELIKRAFVGPFSIEEYSELDFPEEQVLPFWTSAIDVKFTMPSTLTEINWRDF